MAERDRARRLAEQVRAAVSSVSPETVELVEPDAATPEERAAHAAAGRAAGHLMPSIPPGARLAPVKRAALRALRFLWREQTSFNALALESFDGLRQALARERRERLDTLGRMETALEEERRAAARRSAIQDGRLAALEAERARPAPASSSVAPVSVAAQGAPALPPGLYSLFEERFRGPAEAVAAKQRFYLPFLADAPGPVLDVGCGRGEFLRLLKEEGIEASGVEANPIAAAQCRQEGLSVVEGDGIAALASIAPSSLGGVVAFQVVEHWPPESIFAFLREARRALAPGGVLVAETINIDSLSAWRAFFLDPSHVRPVPPEALRFLAEAAGLVDTRIELLAPLPESERLQESTANDAKLNRLLFGPQDYALIARAPGPRR
ncbi:MAG TPA: class I SAM-dependent methyltransferase [Thermoanaerobaculia bacterium]|nr:class I SAM-dependent methyltransferase [Thermoanaerobaculia bacterium]